MERRVDEKKARLLKALELGVTQVHLDARRPGVLVPPKLKDDHHLILNVSYRFEPPDLSVNEWGVRETLSFQGQRFTVRLPWSSIYAVASMVSREFWMYPDDMPEELLKGTVDKQTLVTAVQPLPEKPVLREVMLAPAPKMEENDQTEPPTEPAPPKRGHLRLVK